MKLKFDARSLNALKPKAAIYDVTDTHRDSPRAFGARIMPTGEITLTLYRRFPGSLAPLRRALGRFDGTLASITAARKKARAWLDEIEAGRDPSREKKRREQAAIQAERAKRANSVERALSAYITSKAHLRTVRALETELRRELKPWIESGKSLADIDKAAVVDLIRGIQARGSTGQARVIYTNVKGFLNWVVRTDDYGIAASPCAKIDMETLVGQKQKRERTLDDYEICAYWRAAEKIGGPIGAFFQTLLLTGLRRGEVSNARWTEFEEKGRWIIPAIRMKARPGKARIHLVPLTGAIMKVLDGLPKRGPFVFTLASNGAKPIASFVYFKRQLDALMKADLEAQDRSFQSFVIHDIRHTCRTRFSSIGIEEHIGERLLAHAQPEMTARYNHFGYEKEKREALKKWHGWLADLIDPRPALRVVA